MRRSVLLALLAVVVALAAGPAAAQAANGRVSLDECGVVTAKRLTGATFSGEMEYVDGAASMSMRFELFTRPAGTSSYSRVPGTEETVRRRAVRLYRYGPRTFVLPDLNSAADYRARITFRWYDRGGRVVRTQRRTSEVCRLVPLADLAPETLTTTVGVQPGLMTYTVAVRNHGRADAGPFDVALRIGGERRPPVTVAGLAAGETRAVSFVAPRCAAGDVLRFEVDPDGRVAEADEDDNVLSVACPTP